jgi:hypothetical protein
LIQLQAGLWLNDPGAAAASCIGRSEDGYIRFPARGGPAGQAPFDAATPLALPLRPLLALPGGFCGVRILANIDHGERVEKS